LRSGRYSRIRRSGDSRSGGGWPLCVSADSDSLALETGLGVRGETKTGRRVLDAGRSLGLALVQSLEFLSPTDPRGLGVLPDVGEAVVGGGGTSGGNLESVGIAVGTCANVLSSNPRYRILRPVWHGLGEGAARQDVGLNPNGESIKEDGSW